MIITFRTGRDDNSVRGQAFPAEAVAGTIELSSRPERSVVEGPAVSSRNNLDLALEAAIMELLAQRGPGKTICPSEAARLVDPSGWEEWMDKARDAARRLVARGEIVITQRGRIIDPSKAKGPIRLKIR